MGCDHPALVTMGPQTPRIYDLLRGQQISGEIQSQVKAFLRCISMAEEAPSYMECYQALLRECTSPNTLSTCKSLKLCAIF